MMPVQIDEDLLKQIAAETGGKYFRADDNTKLAEIYSEIGQMEKTRTTVDSFPIYKDLFPKYAVWALVCLLLEVLLRALLRRLP
jgi:Ca-activated chloride channel family protein